MQIAPRQATFTPRASLQFLDIALKYADFVATSPERANALTLQWKGVFAGNAAKMLIPQRPLEPMRAASAQAYAGANLLLSASKELAAIGTAAPSPELLSSISQKASAAAVEFRDALRIIHSCS